MPVRIDGKYGIIAGNAEPADEMEGVMTNITQLCLGKLYTICFCVLFGFPGHTEAAGTSGFAAIAAALCTAAATPAGHQNAAATNGAISGNRLD